MSFEAALPAIVIGSTLIDALGALAMLFPAPGKRGRWDAPWTVGLDRLARAALAAALLFAAKLPPLATAGLDRFGLIHLLFVDAVILVPLLGLALVLAERPGPGGRPPRLRLTRPVRALAWAGLVPAAVGVYAGAIEPYRLQLETARVGVPPARAGSRPVRLGVLSDLQIAHVGAYETEAVARLLAQRPDVILIPGDVFQGDEAAFEAELPALCDLLGRLDAPGGVFLVPGDVDRPLERLERLAAATGLTLLVDEAATVIVGDRRLTIGGVALDYAGPAARRLVARLESAPGADDVRILVAHRPDVVLGLRPGSRIDLVVAGHTHGGQVVVPGFGPPLTLSRVPRAVAAGGLHRLGGPPIYVSRGVGHEHGQAPRLRLFCPPEISLLTLGTGT